MSLRELRRLVERVHDCTAIHRGSVLVEEAFQEPIIWRGYVEVFDITGHPTATRCYAWSYDLDGGPTRYRTILSLGPVNSPQAAVRSAVMSEDRRAEQ